MTFKFRSVIFSYLLPILLVIEGCGPFDNLERRTYSPSSFAQTSDSLRTVLRKQSPYIKLHMRSGDVFVLDKWTTDNTRGIVQGDGQLYSPMREMIGADKFSIGLDSVTIVETNRLSTSGAEMALTLFMGVTGAITVFCITSPKTCFGSCPTFYVTDIDTLRPRAEGFSASVAPSLEATDCDALGDVPLASKHVTIEMRNEALETHVVRSVSLLAVPKHDGSTIYKDDKGSFRECGDLLPPARAVADEGDCLTLLGTADGHERMSRADSTDLAAKETVECEFDRIPGDTCGIVIGCRQSLMTTFLFYKTLGYMGKDAGQWFAEMERSSTNEPMDALEELLGGVDVSVVDSAGAWKKIGTVLEYGPLATDIHLLPLPPAAERPLRVRLEMTKGYWRIDNVGIVRMGQAVEPICVAPAIVLRDGIEDVAARTLLMDSAKTLVTKPGDNYTMRFDLPENADRYGLFLESRGYYLEWIRQSWMSEENPLALAEILIDPASALRRLAPEFTETEKAIEAQFWRSKYAR
jgi:hypothetical protein